MRARPISLAGQQKPRLLLVFGLTTAYLVVEVVAGLLTGSLALLADAGHMLADVGGLALAGLIMLLTGWYRADPLISAAIGLFILPRTWSLLNQSIHVLMEGSPPGIDLEEVIRAMQAVEGVRGVHDIHLWTITSGFEALTGHVIVEGFAERQAVLRRLQEILAERFGVRHVTLQIEEPRPVSEENRGGTEGHF